MSEDPKMGLLGSTELKEATDKNKDKRQALVDRSSERESKDCSKDTISTMDISDMIDITSEGAIESTLESEIDALSKIIGTKDGAQKLDDNDDDFKLDSDDIAFTANLECDTIESDKDEFLTDDSLSIKDILNRSGELKNFISGSVTEPKLQEVLNEAETSNSPKGIPKVKETEKISKEQAENFEIIFGTKDITETNSPNVNNSSLLISEAYNSEEYQSNLKDQSISIPGTAKLTESVESKVTSKNPTNITDVTETCTSSIEVEPTDVPTKISINDPVGNKLDSETIIESVEKNTEGNNQLDFAQAVEPVELKNIMIECEPVSESIDQDLKSVVKVTPIEDDSNNQAKNNEQNESAKESQESECKNNTDEFQQEICKVECKNNTDEFQQEICKVECKMEDESNETNILFSEMQDPLDIENEELTNLPQNIIGDTVDDENITQGSKTEPERETISKDPESHELSLEIHENIDNLESIDTCKPSEEDVKTITNSKENLTLSNENDHTTEEEKIIEFPESTNVDKNIELSKNLEEEIDIECSQNTNIDINKDSKQEKKIDYLQELEGNVNTDVSQDLESNENIENSERINVDVDLESLQESVNDSELMQIETINDQEPSQTETINDEEPSQDVDPLENIEFRAATEPTQDMETVNNIEPVDNAESLDNTDMNTEIETSEESEITSHTDSSQNAIAIENAHIVQNMTVDTGIESLEISDMDSNMDTLQDVESLKEEINIECEGIKVVKDNVKDEAVASTSESDVINEKEPGELIPSDMVCNNEESKNLMETKDNVIANSEPQDNILITDIHKIDNEDLPTPENINIVNSENKEIEDNDEQSVINNLSSKETVTNEIVASVRVDTPEDLNITLELEEPELLEKSNIIETHQMHQEVEKFEEENKINIIRENEISVETNVREQPAEEAKQSSEEETEDQEDINLTLDPEDYNSPTSQGLPEEQMIIDDPFSELLGKIDANPSEISELPEAAKPDLSEVLDTNQKVGVIDTDDQGSVLQELDSSIFDNGNKDLSQDLNELLETENDTQVEDLPTSETSNPSAKDFQLLDEKSRDSLPIFDGLETEPMSTDKENEKNKDTGSAEKDEDITLVFEESSHSPRQTDDNSNNSHVLEDANKNNDASFSCIMESYEPASATEQKNENNTKEVEKENENFENSESLEIEGNTQLKAETSNTHSTFLLNDMETVKSTGELTGISESESAVKFLQESENQDSDNAKMVGDVIINEERSSIFVSVEDSVCDNASEFISDLPETTLDPIAISEAEIISEAAKLENERKEKLKLEEQLKNLVQDSSDLDSMDIIETIPLLTTDNLSTNVEPVEQSSSIPEISSKDPLKIPLITETILKSESLPKASMLDERYKEPPKIEIPEVSPKIIDIPTTPKASLLIPRDAKNQRLESPDRFAAVSSEPRISDTPKKESSSDKQQYSEFENVGSPRIILKIAKSAIAECSEPRSPKSPKIRSAANSPNPEDSPGQKLGKIKLKLSKGGHPSIIPNNDNFDETAQWHTDSASSLSPLGMKIKLTKSTDAAAVVEDPQKLEDAKDKVSHKAEERKPETSIGMKIKLSKSGDASIVQQDSKDANQDSLATKKQDSPSIGMKIKLSKSGDASIIQQDSKSEEYKESSKNKVVEDIQEGTRRTESPIGMKIKFSKSGDASVIASEPLDMAKELSEIKDKPEEPSKRTDSPIGVKIKLAKTKGGSTSVITTECIEDDGSKRSKQSRKRETSEEIFEMTNESDAAPSDVTDEASKSGLGMKIKLSKTGDTASVVHLKKEDSSVEMVKKVTEQPLGMKIKLSKTGDPSIILPEIPKETEEVIHSSKTKHSKNKDYGISGQQKSKDDSLEMKIKLSKTGHPTIINTNEIQEDPLKIPSLSAASQSHKHKDLLSFKESTLKAIKKSHSDVTIEPVKNPTMENTMIDLHNKRKEITISPIETKKSKMEANLKQMLPDITIQPIMSAAKKEQQQQQHKLLLESNSGSISRQQMNVINQEISITQICSLSSGDTLMGEHLKSALGEPSTSSPLNSDCEIIEPQPELIIVNENSNSSQDIMIIDEVPKSTTKVPKKRGRPRRNANIAVASAVTAANLGMSGFQDVELQRDPLSLDQPPVTNILQQQMHMQMQMHMHQVQQMQQQMPLQLQQQVRGPQIVPGSVEGSERPRRTCRSQKSYAPPKRGRGRGRGKRKNETTDIPMKKQRIDQDLTAIENSTTAVISLEKLPIVHATANLSSSSELFKALNQPTLAQTSVPTNEVEILEVQPQRSMQILPMCEEMVMPSQAIQPEMSVAPEEIQITTKMTAASIDPTATTASADSDDMSQVTEMSAIVSRMDEAVDKSNVITIQVTEEQEKQSETNEEQAMLVEGTKDPTVIQEHQNWLAPSIKKVPSEPTTRTESISTLTVIDEETRMSAESGSRSQTPARNISVPGTSETLVNEESQGSTATTESEKVKVKNRRMEISFDPDEGPFTVEKIAEYEWPLDKKEDKPAGRGETFMIQEQISQYLGVKSFKRKYPDLKRRMVDMEERNFLRENGLVSESMCDMGLTAVSSSEVLDIMCSDFPEQYEEYRKHMREKAAKEHSKKQKELSAAANAERNRIDLAEMAMQSALSWNAGLNRARKDTRKCSLDLQTFTVHMPKRPVKHNPARRGPNYPVALIPGQYTDYFREYTPAELRYYPLNTVLYGPMRPNERKMFDSQSEGSQSDSDSDSSSDESSSSSSEGTQDTEGSQSTMDEVDMELTLQPDIKCKMCHNHLNKNNRSEVLIQCGTCSGNVHPSCMDLTLDMVPHIRACAWQCADCKTCAQCHDPADEDKMLFCDMCDRGYHIYCVGLRRVPQGRWHCQECAVCANCGSKEPGGANSDRNSVAQWQHEYKKGDKNTRVYVSTFCVPCSKVRGNQGVDN